MSEHDWHDYVDTADGRYVSETEAAAEIERLKEWQAKVLDAANCDGERIFQIGEDLTAAEQRVAEMEAEVESARQATGLVKHNTPEECDGCGCISVGLVELVDTLRNRAERSESALAGSREDMARMQSAANGLVEKCRKHLAPFFPPDTRDLDWDVFPGAVAQVCQRLAASESRAAGLAAALDRLARLGNGSNYGNSHGNKIAQDALAASGLECVRGHLVPTSHGWSWEPNATDERPGWLVYHKEQQHGA